MASASASVSVPRISLSRPATFNPVQFTPMYGQHLTPDVNILANSLKNFEERQYKAAESMAKVNDTITQIRGLVHDDADTENWFNGLRNGTIDKMQQSIDEGNYGRAIFDSIGLASQILSRPDVTGRIKTNAAYEEFRKSVMSANISDEQKQYLLATNPYFYADRYGDETSEEAIVNREKEKQLASIGQPVVHEGPIVGGTSWTPSQNVVAEHDISEVLAKAMTLITAEKGSGYSLAFKDMKGNETTEDNSDGYYYAKRGSSWERISQQTIEKAMSQVLATNPEYRDALNRQYDIMKWRYDNGKEEQFGEGLLNANGVVKSRDKWFNDIIKQTAKGKAYNHVVNDIDINEKYYEEQSAYRKNAAAQEGPVYDYGDMSKNYSFAVDLHNAPSLARMAYVASEKDIRKLLSDKYKYYSKDVTALLNGEKSIDKFTIVSPEDKLALSRLMGMYSENRAYYNDIVSKTNNPEIIEAIDFTSGAFSYNPNATTNKYAKEVAKQINSLGLTEDDYFYLKFEDAGKARDFETLLGLEAKSSGNELVISIPVKDYSTVLTAAGLFYNNNSIFNFENGISVATSKNPNYKSDVNSGFMNFGQNITDGGYALSQIGKLYNDAIETRDDFLNEINASKAIISNLNLPGADFSTYQLNRNYNDGLITGEQYTKNKDFITSEIYNKLRGGALLNHMIYVRDPENEQGEYLIRVDNSADRQKYNELLQEALALNEDNVVLNAASFAYSTNGYGTNITISPHRKQKGMNGQYTDSSITIYVDGLYNNKAAEKFANDSNVRAQTKYTKQEAINGYISISGTGTDFDGLQFKPNSYSHSAFTADGEEFSRESVINIMNGQNIIDETRATVRAYGIEGIHKNGRVPMDRVNAAAAQAAEMMCRAYGDVSDINTIKNQIINSIMPK